MNALPAVFALVVILFGGWGVGFSMLPREKSIPAMAVRAWLLGAVLVSVSLGLLGTVLWGTALLAVVAIVSVIPGLAAVRKIVRERIPVFAWRRPGGFAEWALCAVILCECAVLARYAWTTALGWDGLMVWEIKARIAFANGGSLPPDYFTDTTRAFSHPDYPPMLPLLETWVYLWLGRSDQTFARIIFPPFYLAALYLLYSGVAQVSGKRRIGLLTAALLFFVPFLDTGQTNVFTGYADFPLAAFYLAAVVSLNRYGDDPVDSRAILFGINAGALPWMKHEGTLLWLCVMLVAGVEFACKRRIRQALLAAGPGLVAIIGWKIAVLSTRSIQTHEFMPATMGNVTSHLDRVGTIAQFVFRELTATAHWSILWFIFPIALGAAAASGRRRLSAQLGAVVLIPLALYSGIYILSSRLAYEAHIDSSLPRLVSQLSLVALLTLGIAISECAA